MRQPERGYEAHLILLVFGLCLGLTTSPASAAENNFHIWAVYAYDDNISRSLMRGEQESDHSLRLEGTANWRLPAGPNASADFGVMAAGERRFDFHDLSQLELGGRAGWRWRPIQGFSAPMYNFDVDLTGHAHKDSKIRDGGTLRATVGAQSRLTERLSIRGGYRFTMRRARSSNVFDNERHGLFAASELILDPAVVLSASVAWERGDVVANSTPTAPVIAAATALVVDDAFGPSRLAGQMGPGPGPGPGPDPGPGPGPNGGERVAYRLDADVWRFEVGTRIRLGLRTTLDLSSSYLKVDARGSNLDYDGMQVIASLGYAL